MEFVNEAVEISDNKTNNSKDIIDHDHFKSSFDQVMRSLLSEVDDSRKNFDKKW